MALSIAEQAVASPVPRELWSDCSAGGVSGDGADIRTRPEADREVRLLLLKRRTPPGRYAGSITGASNGSLDRRLNRPRLLGLHAWTAIAMARHCS